TGLAWQVVDSAVAAALEAGLLLRTSRGYRPSARGLQFLNDLLLRFLPETPGNSGASALSMATPEVPAIACETFIQRRPRLRRRMSKLRVISAKPLDELSISL